MKKDEAIEIRWHGRGGQGAVTSAELLALAAISEGRFAQAFPSFGPERRGAPVLAFNRISSVGHVRIRAAVTHPDIVVVLDPGLLDIADVMSGLKQDGTLVINTPKPLIDIKSEISGPWKLAVVNATAIAREVLGVPIVNTAMLGALVKATEILGLESLVEPIKERFGPRAKNNIDACHRAYEETLVAEMSVVEQKPRKAFETERLLSWQELLPGCVVTEAGNAKQYRTVTGSRSIQSGTIKGASNVEFVLSFVLRAVSGKIRKPISKPIYIIARDVAFVLVSAGQRL